jgi:gamma-glutamyl phosphate reductase
MAGCDNYDEIIRALDAAIEDEHKAQDEYNRLADKALQVLAGAYPSGSVAYNAIQTIVVDEKKHEDFLMKLRKTIIKECEE